MNNRNEQAKTVAPETEQSFSWLRKIPGDLLALDEKPLYGFPPVFPWDKLSNEIGNILQCVSLQITAGDIQWKTADEICSNLGGMVKGFLLSLNPIPGKVWWIMPQQAIARLMIQLLSKEHQSIVENQIETDFLNGFFYFIAIEAIQAFEKTDFDKKLSPVIANISSLPEESCLCLDIDIAVDGQHHYGCLCLSNEFRRGWNQHYLKQGKALALASPLADSLDVTIHLEVGKVDLKPSEWKNVSIGDFVLIDSCSIDPEEEKGRVMLVINSTPCFRARIKNGSLKILEHPLYYEVDKSMPTPPPIRPKDEADHDEDHTDEESQEEEVEDLFDEDDYSDSDHDEISDAEDNEDFDFDDIETSVPAASNEKKQTEKKVLPKQSASVSRTAASEEEKKVEGIKLMQEAAPSKPLAAEEIPLPVVIEIGRIQMTVKKLMELQPGNMLDLDIHPESGVDMVVNGKRIARGDLLRIGESLGIRITQLS